MPDYMTPGLVPGVVVIGLPVADGRDRRDGVESSRSTHCRSRPEPGTGGVKLLAAKRPFAAFGKLLLMSRVTSLVSPN
jgi:hypothetical protein